MWCSISNISDASSDALECIFVKCCIALCFAVSVIVSLSLKVDKLLLFCTSEFEVTTL